VGYETNPKLEKRKEATTGLDTERQRSDSTSGCHKQKEKKRHGNGGVNWRGFQTESGDKGRCSTNSVT